MKKDEIGQYYQIILIDNVSTDDLTGKIKLWL
jgi:hypothetical protein